MVKTVLFIDEVCPKPYDLNTLQNEPLGGTEATVIRVAEGLATTGLFKVLVEQHNRTLESSHYLPSNTAKQADYVICLRDPSSLYKARERFPRSKIYLWSHDIATRILGLALPLIKEAESDILCVSDYHKQQTQDLLLSYGYKGEFKIRRIYNPVDDSLKPDATAYDKNKLVWFSSPHKGLEYALEVFNNLLSFNPDFQLYVSNPGYFPDYASRPRNVVNVGSLSHSAIISHVRQSLCVFYPNVVFPETFGLVYAEANMVGTPVVAHNMGAASEILDHPAELLDCRNPKNVIDRVMAWHSGERPIVRGQSEFKLKNVIMSWINNILRQ